MFALKFLLPSLLILLGSSLAMAETAPTTDSAMPQQTERKPIPADIFRQGI